MIKLSRSCSGRSLWIANSATRFGISAEALYLKGDTAAAIAEYEHKHGRSTTIRKLSALLGRALTRTPVKKTKRLEIGSRA